ncbi:MAG: hypothetical protein ABFR35_01840 [Thermodesulfobacteriota bacterium]
MRCTKCGFISFDHLASCAKCGRDISEVASELQGTSIKVEAPMFLGGALAALSESEESFEDHAMEADGDEGIDFDMEMEAGGEEAGETAVAEEDVDFSFEKEAEEFEVAEGTDIGLAEPEAEEAAGIEEKTEEAADFEIEAEAKEEPELEKAGESFEELDFMGAVDDEEEGGLEFDLEDFMEDIDDDKPEASATEGTVDIDLDLGDEENK